MNSALPIFALAISILTGGCAAGNDVATTPAPESATCSDQALGSFIGQKASTETGAALQNTSGARTLRWAPPRSAVTMDFRPDRLTVSYDDAMTIISARCG